MSSTALPLPRPASARPPIPAAAGAVVAVPSLLVLAGWAFDRDGLDDGVLRSAISRPVPLLCFAVVGVALVAYGLPVSARVRAACTAALGGVAVLGLLGLVGVARMPFNSALAFLFLAPGLAFVAPGRAPDQVRPAQVALVAAVVLGFVAFTGYLVGAVAFSGVESTRTAPPGAIGLMLAGMAALALRPREGLLAVLAAPSPAGALLRNLLPAVIVAPMVLGGLRYVGQREGLYGSSVGIWIMVLAMTAFLVAVVARAARVLERTDAERRRAEARLAELVTELERSNAELEQFAYVASHDLAEPLRVVSGFAQLLQRRYAGRLDERADTYIQQTVEGTVRMRTLIEDLLAYSRVGRAELDPEPVPLAELVEEERAAQAARLEETGGRLEVVGELPVVRGERVLLGQLVHNLIGNGLKYHGDGPPRVEIGADAVPGAWRLRVRDHGIGIPPEYRERVFKMFQRLHSRDEYEGTGIGLAICRRIAERHGGGIEIEETPGGGATFVVTLRRDG